MRVNITITKGWWFKLEKYYEVNENLLILYHFLHGMYNSFDNMPEKLKKQFDKLLRNIANELDKELLPMDILDQQLYRKVVYKTDYDKNKNIG